MYITIAFVLIVYFKMYVFLFKVTEGGEINLCVCDLLCGFQKLRLLGPNFFAFFIQRVNLSDCYLMLYKLLCFDCKDVNLLCYLLDRL